MDAIRIGVVGDYQETNPTHLATGTAAEHAADRRGWRAEMAWIPTPRVEGGTEQALAGFDAVWIAPGSPYRSMGGALDAITYARPGTCRCSAPAAASST